MGLDPHLFLYDLRRRFLVDSEHAQQNMSNPSFMGHLYKHSPWIKGIFTYELDLTGGTLDEEHSFGEGQDELFSKADLEKFMQELRTVPRPNDDEYLVWNYDHLFRLVTTALSKPNLTLTRANL